MKRPLQKPDGYERCGSCGALVRVVVRDEIPIGFEKHKVPSSSAWCKNGTQPVARPKKKPKGSHKGKSVRAIGGGLPGLGKRP
jgi:hypothetical protein